MAFSVSIAEYIDVISLYPHNRTSDHIRPLRSVAIKPLHTLFFFLPLLHATQNT